jgi:putative endonuclease
MIASALPHTLDVLASVTQTTLRVLDRLGAKRRSQKHLPVHQQVGRRGEEDAYFYLRKLGYVMVARNYRSAGRRGEIDLIGWDSGILCFIEVKTRTSYDVKPAEAAVDHEKRRELAGMARAYLRRACRRCHGVSTWSAYTMKLRRRPHALSCSKMPSNYRKINDSAAS